MDLALGQMSEDRQITVVIQKQMQFHRSLGLAESRPIVHVQAQINHAGVQAQELILEAQLLFGRQALCQAKLIVEDLLEDLPGPLGVGVGQGRTFRTFLEAQMIEFAFATGQAVADFAPRFGLGQLAEHHGDEFTPAAEALGGFLRTAFLNSPRELVPVDH